jgi:hypothetical protein
VIVVDASVAVKWVVEEPGRSEAMRVFDMGERLMAPDLVFAEVANVLRKKARRQEITPHHAKDAMIALRDVPMEVVPSSELASSALGLALDLDHSAYDCFYLACSLQTGQLLTADEVFAKKCAAAGFGTFAVALSAVEHALRVDEHGIDDRLTEDVSRLARKMEETFDALEATARSGDGGLRFISVEVFGPAFSSPAYRRLWDLLGTLEPEQIAQLTALGWLGRRHHDASEWSSLLDNARYHAARGGSDNFRYVIAQMPLVAAGLKKLRASLEQNEG